mgnify:CR=1 FL=1
MSSNGYDEQEGFLARWSRLKARSLRGEELPDPEAEADEDVESQTAGKRPDSGAGGQVSHQLQVPAMLDAIIENPRRRRLEQPGGAHRPGHHQIRLFRHRARDLPAGALDEIRFSAAQQLPGAVGRLDDLDGDGSITTKRKPVAAPVTRGRLD